MGKLCCYFNIPSHYRQEVYQLIDQTYDCDWYFGPNPSDVKEMDRSLLKRVFTYKTWNIGSSLQWQKGMLSLLFRKEYNCYLMIGEFRSLSWWIFIILIHLFFPSKKVYGWGHGWHGWESKGEALVKLRLLKWLDGFFSYSKYAKKHLVKMGIDESKLFVINNAMNHSLQLEVRKTLKPSSIYHEHFGNTLPTIIYIGRIYRRKKIGMLLDAMNMLYKNNQYFNLVIVGGGKDVNVFEKQVKDNGLEQYVWMYGSCYDESINAELIYNADLCVTPGDVGLTAIHSMTYGTPLVTHDNFVCQGPEFEAVVPGETGDFFKFDDVSSLVECITHWFSSKKCKRELVRTKCYEEVERNWTPKFQVDTIKSVIRLHDKK